MIDFGLGNGWLALVGAVLVAVMLAVPLGRAYARRLKRLVAFCRGIPLFCRIAFAAVFATLLERNACLPGCVWNATPRSLSPLERNIGFWTQA